ncbi:glycosyltransferase family 2 protein [Brachyspira hyodysenteriae]|uniref:glycosyltransferase family 2 protein n=1 Tax=Brachyspira hyodysenteriae TaxID=159 RepID=UPI00063DBC2D|nr:glycosyltransferase family 2 protein [Brachyspira hyodysenteriae]KLI17834.1 beta-1, 3-galactosyltransferase [Brachyspira hyodysenteriae]
MIKVSVVLPIYNVEKYLPKCLESIINQTLKDIEIICINDCSPDNSENIIKEYIKKDNRIKLINNEKNIGVGVSRNIGIDSSNGEYISFIDSDDFIESNYIENLYGTAVKYNSDIVFTNNIYTVNESKGYIKPYYHNRLEKWKKDFKDKCFEGESNFNVSTTEKENTPEYPLVAVWNKLYKKSFITDNNLKFQNYIVAEDSEFFYKYLVYKPKMHYNNNAKYYYVQRKSSAVHSIEKDERTASDALSVFSNIFNFYKEKNINLLKESNFYNFNSFLFVFNNYKAPNKNEFYKKCHELMKKLDVEIDREKHAFYAYSVYIMKTYDDYNIYLEKIESIKKKVFDIAWWIPSITLREKYKKINLDKLANKNWK